MRVLALQPARRVLGIDPGPRNCGYAMIEIGLGWRIVCVSGHWRSVSGDVNEQIVEIGKRFMDMLKSGAPDLVGIEAWTFQRPGGHSSQSINTTTVPRVIERLRTLAGIELYQSVTVTTSQAKSALGLKGKCSKDRVRRAVEAWFPGANIPNEHAVDAIAVAVAADRKWRAKAYPEWRPA